MVCISAQFQYRVLIVLLMKAGFSKSDEESVQVVVASQGLNSAYKSPTAELIIRNDGNQDFNVKEGDSFTIRCKATGHPKPTITWTLLGGRLFQRNLNLRNSSLYISNIRRSEQSRIVCKASNGIGNPAFVTKRIQVIYMDKPTLSVGIAGYEHDSNSIWYQKSVYFLCEVKCIPRAVYIWKKNGVVIAGTDGVTIQNSNDRFSGVSITRLLIDNVKDSDVGRYECVATLGRMGRLFNIDDTAANFFYRLNIAPTQIEILGPSSIVVNKDDAVRATCRISGGVPQGSLKWLRDDGTLKSSTANLTRLDLIIPQANYNDTGYYFCVGNNRVGILSQKRLQVFVRRLGAMTHWITPLRYSDSNWRLGDVGDVRLSCHADADPTSELQYTWYKKTRQGTRAYISPTGVKGLTITLNKEEEVKRAYTIPAMTSRLHISSLSRDDYGVYECVATLKGSANYSEVNASIALGRDSAPSEITATRYRILAKEGSDVTLKCEANGVPKPLFLFYREENMTLPSGNGVDVSKDGKLVLRNVSRNDGGLYVCEAARYNGFTKLAKSRTSAGIDVEVLYPPSVKNGYSDIRKPLNAKLVLTCLIKDANPINNTIFEWFKDDVSQGPSSRHDQIQIQFVNKEHYGLYKCVVSNSIGKTQCIFNVSNIPYEPELVHADSYITLKKSGSKSDTYTYVLQWTQRLPRAVEPVIKYTINWKLVEAKNWSEAIKLTPGGAKYGQLIDFPIRNLKTGFYEVVVRSASRYREGASARKIFEVHPRITRDVNNQPKFNLIGGSYFCSFSVQSRCQFSQPPTNSISWILNSNRTQLRRTQGTGPDFDRSDHEKDGAYMYIESSATKRGNTAKLLSPFFLHGRTTENCLRFFYHMKGNHIGRLRVLVSDQKGNEKVLWNRKGHQGNSWNSAILSISQPSQYRITFEATLYYDDGYQGDIAIDDISLDPLECIFPSTTVGPENNSPGGSSEFSKQALSSIKATLHWTSIVQKIMHETYAKTLLFCFIFQFVITKLHTNS